MNRHTTQLIFRRVLAGEAFTEEMLDVLRQTSEDQFFDAKDGATNRKDCATLVRKYVSGFANTAGGLLLIGLTNDSPRRVNTFSDTGDATLVEWVSRICTRFASFAALPPLFFAHQAKDGQVLVIVTPRSDNNLVPVVEGGRYEYYARLGDSTLPMPEEMVADLLHGRRNHPVLNLQIDRNAVPTSPEQVDGVQTLIGAGFVFSIENIGFIDAMDADVGVIGWTWPRPEPPGLNRHLEAHLELLRPTTSVAPLHRRVSQASLTSGLGSRGLICVPAFESAKTHGALGFKIPLGRNITLAKLAVYIRTRNSLPTWYQMEMKLAYTGGPKSHGMYVHPGDVTVGEISLCKVTGTRPIVSIDYL